MCYSVLIESSLKKLENQYNARILDEAFDRFIFNSKNDPKKYKPIEQNERIFPKYWAPIIHGEGRRRVITPMRYRVIPSWSDEEIPSKYNTYNARLDSLDSRKTWKGIFTRNHGIIVFKEFYEWVKGKDGKKVVATFRPNNRESLVAPILYDNWQSPNKSDSITSFAIITTTPYPEVMRAGHDRSPIILKPENVDTWLNPSETGKQKLTEILQDVDSVKFDSVI